MKAESKAMTITNMSLDRQKMDALLIKLRAGSSNPSLHAGIDNLAEKMEKEQTREILVNNLGAATEEEVAEVISDILTTDTALPATTGVIVPATTGVTANITLNEEQQQFVDLVLSGIDCCLIGAAGTGKTTSMRAVTRALIDGGHLPIIRRHTKYIGAGQPGMVICSFTNKAVNNIRRAVVPELRKNTITVHKLLEFAPVFYEVEDPAKPGHLKNTMKFEPTYNKHNPLPPEIRVVAFEEASMLDVPLYQNYLDAMWHDHQEIFLGDIQQLPPVFGSAILGFKLNELEVVELTKIYRQAAASPIIDLAHKLLAGDKKVFSPAAIKVREKHPATGKVIERRRIPALDALSKETPNGTVLFQPWQKTLTEEVVIPAFVAQLKVWHKQDYYNPQEDIILCPFNVNIGTIELNKQIAQYLGRDREAVVHHVIAGFEHHYLAVGDRVLYAKEDARIVGIRKNPSYMGKVTMTPSVYLNRWGAYEQNITHEEAAAHEHDSTNLSAEAIDKMMDIGEGITEDSKDRVNAASHILEVKLNYGDEDENIILLTTAGDIRNLLGGYAITIHKSQGSEWENVFLFLHISHQMRVSRELLYTACTRARNRLHIICEADTFYKGITSQQISGNTLREKANIFMGKALAPGANVPVSSNKSPGLLPKPRARAAYVGYKEIARRVKENSKFRVIIEEETQDDTLEQLDSDICIVDYTELVPADAWVAVAGEEQETEQAPAPKSVTKESVDKIAELLAKLKLLSGKK